MNSDRTECRAVNELLVALAAGELECEHAAQLRAHLELCANCQAAFVEINRAGELARSLKLTSPELDRYPEFLRRLAASEARSLSVATPVSLIPVEHDGGLAAGANVPAEAGMAAVIPIFGNRLAVRNGFGQGFDLSITSSQGKQWLHLSAKSLTRVAAVTAGVSLVAGISVVALVLLFFSARHNESQPQAPQQAVGPSPKRNLDFPPVREDGLWIQTASNAERTLAIWKGEAQLQSVLIEHRRQSLSKRLTLSPPFAGSRLPRPPRMADCSVATDGTDFVVLLEIESAVYVWHLSPQSSGSEKDAAGVAPPILLSGKGVQPGVTWVGDHYVAVWVAPDVTSPVVEMIELGSNGRPLQASATVVARTDQGDKVGLPGVAGGNGRVLVTYFVQSGALMARMFMKTGDTYLPSAAVEISNAEGPYHRPIRLLSVPDGYLACWDVPKDDGAEIRLARLDREGSRLSLKTLARARAPITSFDMKPLGGGQVILLWSEVQPGGALTFTQHFSADGDPLKSPRNVFVADNKPSAVVFGDAEGTSLVWSGTLHPDRFPIGVKQIGKQ
ncbi:MAG: anti-sigma factor [Acidobacteriota bacterium]